jgi:hypothetical protein
MDTNNKKLRRTAIAARLPSDKLPSVIASFTNSAAAIARAPDAMAPRGAPSHDQLPTTVRKTRRSPSEH